MKSKFTTVAAIAVLVSAGLGTNASANMLESHHRTTGRTSMTHERITTHEVVDGFVHAPLGLARGIAMMPGRVGATLWHSPTTAYGVIRGERPLFGRTASAHETRVANNGTNSRTYSASTRRHTWYASQRMQHHGPPV